MELHDYHLRQDSDRNPELNRYCLLLTLLSKLTLAVIFLAAYMAVSYWP
jgi:hypothetical protein